MESKQSKGAKNCTNIRWKLAGKICSKTFIKIIERKNNLTLSYIDDFNTKKDT